MFFQLVKSHRDLPGQEEHHQGIQNVQQDVIKVEQKCVGSSGAIFQHPGEICDWFIVRCTVINGKDFPGSVQKERSLVKDQLFVIDIHEARSEQRSQNQQGYAGQDDQQEPYREFPVLVLTLFFTGTLFPFLVGLSPTHRCLYSSI